MADTLPIWKGKLMNQSGCLTLIKTTLYAMSVYMEIKTMKAFHWMGMDIVQGSKCLIAWCWVQRPLQLGGLGVKGLNLFGRALRTRWLWLQHTATDSSWASLPFNVDKDMAEFCKASTYWQIGDSSMTLFWSDAWLDGQSIADMAPELVATVFRWACKS
jgi:hypothetical protein